ncbi:hypothetical protein PV326_008035 [Microctonus aethiopoides]|nr:hypothetical protein PV326_008035 [Microctonus aethiopoides]
MKFVDVTSQECGAPLVCYKLDDSGILEKIKDLPYPVAGTKCGENKSSAFRDKPHEIETIINKNAKPLSQHKCYQIKESKHGFPKDLQEQLRKIIFSEDLKSTLSEHVKDRHAPLIITADPLAPDYLLLPENLFKHQLSSKILSDLSKIPYKLRDCCQKQFNNKFDKDPYNICCESKKYVIVWEKERRYPITAIKMTIED